ncbi:MAG: LSU ribosomal protein L31p [Candidatus Ozemobacter sibiricus]|jgi:large subunit ribosomal protein L31|uniref:Large ribosomal subunit protein bL31 n=1 Tax=Candidatus Ozemobacter sibiricus TaxID=2268124 RepID=A0A367ZLZ1_9BACT|nr:MAG: LSU ribosomal protein L31p [Candidatus Ozemobacter sibiricus]
MKPKIHPEFHKINVTCACGNAFESMSTAKELKVEVCSACHPFFTGTQRFVDTAGRVERFQAKVEAQKAAAAQAAAAKEKKTRRPKAAAAPAPATTTTPEPTPEA